MFSFGPPEPGLSATQTLQLSEDAVKLMSLVMTGRCRYTPPFYLFLGNLLPEPDADEN